MHDYIIVNYITQDTNEIFIVSEHEERHQKTKRFRVLRKLISFIPLVLKILM